MIWLEPFDPGGPIGILLCWERPDQSCHRRLVAEWLEEALGIPVPEDQPSRQE